MLETPIEYLKGVGPARGALLRSELNILTFEDLLQHFPFRYIDRSEIHKISQINSDVNLIQLKGKLSGIKEIKQKRGSRLEATLTDDSGRVKLVWFKGVKWIAPTLKPNIDYIVFGKPSVYQNGFNIPHPDLQISESDSDVNRGKLQPVYNSGEKLSSMGLNSRGIEKLQRQLLSQLKGMIQEIIPNNIREEYKLIPRSRAIKAIHFPGSNEDLKKAQWRLKFEELFILQLSLGLSKIQREKKHIGYIFTSVGDHFNNFYKKELPFELTAAQKRVLKEIRKDLGSGKQMNRLLQGDVGSGKTLVALMSMLLAIDNGFQTSLMAPTEILARQHANTIYKFVKNLGINVGLLTGSTTKAERKTLHTALRSGHLHILIGTHALIEDQVKFENLGLVVIDEQHRFGVAQRAKLWKKNDIPPHVLVMTATPIPRTLAMTFYGDLDVSVIDELPPGRKAIKTLHRFDKSRLNVFQFMQNEIKKGRQVYIVYPLIEESEKLDYKDLMDGYESIVRRFPMPDYQISIVHGRMKSEDKDFEMKRFLKKETQIMVATTVIEVGVDIPNASVMIIESAERFGLSQLHQLRGRVGRGAEQSYCILMSGHKLSADAKVRLQTMVDTNDGFKISETDLQLRGPGDILGTQQSGMLEFKIANIVTDGKILTLARKAAIEILKRDPGLNSDQISQLRDAMLKYSKKIKLWSQIS